MKYNTQRRLRKSFSRYEYLQFPFLIDRKTVSYYNKNKCLFVLKGFAFFGKTSLASCLKLLYGKNAELILYNNLGNEKQFLKALNDEKTTIIVALDSFSPSLRFYSEKADQFKYFIIILEEKSSLEFELASKPGLVSHASPEYFGFFLNSVDSEYIINKAEAYFIKCLEYFPAFKNFISCESGLKSFERAYNIDYKKQLHCTTLHCNDSSFISYKDKQFVKNTIGKLFKIYIQGFFFTPRTAGVNIKLGRNAFNLFNKNDRFSLKKDSHERIYPTFPHKNLNTVLSQVDSSSFSKTLSSQHSEPYNEISSTFDSKTASKRYSNYNGVISLKKASRAHLTLGSQSGYFAVQTGFDLMELKYRKIIKNELNNSKNSNADFWTQDKFNETIELSEVEKEYILKNILSKSKNCLDEMMIEDGCIFLCEKDACEIQLDWNSPINSIFNAAY